MTVPERPDGGNELGRDRAAGGRSAAPQVGSRRMPAWTVGELFEAPKFTALSWFALLGPGLVSVALAVGLAGIPRFARLVRAGASEVGSEPFIEAARVIGCRPERILLRHVVPNVREIVIPLAALEFGYALLNISALSFLGLGAQPPTPEWGSMLAEGRALLRHAPWVSTAPGLAITLSVLAFNLLGDALSDALKTRTRW